VLLSSGTNIPAAFTIQKLRVGVKIVASIRVTVGVRIRIRVSIMVIYNNDINSS